MSNIAIRVENLSKQYRLGQRERYKSLRDVLSQAAAAPLRRIRSSFQPGENGTIWALKDVSFEVQQGEVVGIIGRNGAGKSTLLKILSRITKPTRGFAEIHGRVGSLLEVGTGFHPELTGRENIYLNGAILGMKRAEIERKFDEIVDFAEIEKFLDTPVKRYSSGMYVRLAFSVAAHLEPEILLVDEVLAVGDAQFQKKCLGKMGNVASEGRTILFVSHNMGAITQLCPKTILIRAGGIEMFNDTEKTVEAYLLSTVQQGTDIRIDPASKPYKQAMVTRCWIADQHGNPVSTPGITDPFTIYLEVLARENISNAEISIRVHSRQGEPLFTTNLSQLTGELVTLTAGMHKFAVQIPAYFLAPGSYSLHVGIHRPNIEILDAHDHLLTFSVEESGSDMWQYYQRGYGSILVQFPWRHEYRKQE